MRMQRMSWMAYFVRRPMTRQVEGTLPFLTSSFVEANSTAALMFEVPDHIDILDFQTAATVRQPSTSPREPPGRALH